MTTYILHGGMMRSHNELNDSFYMRIAALIPDGGKVLLVYFASEENQVPELFKSIQQIIEDLVPEKHLSYARATEERFLEEVQAADAIIFRGGSTDRLIAALRGYPDLAKAFEGKVVAGSSAGAYALAHFNYDKSGKKMREGLGMVNVKCVCHYQSPDLKNNPGDDALGIMDAEHQELELVILKDSEWKEFSV